MANTKLKDPVAEAKKELDGKKAEEEVKVPDPAILVPKTIPDSAAQNVPLFEGYPLADKIKIGKQEVSATFIVLVNPSFVPNQDVSGMRVQIQEHKMKSVTTQSGTYKVMKPDGESKIVNLGTYHSRVLPCHEPPYNGDNYDVVFDRLLELGNGIKRYAAVVTYHTLRAQLMYSMNWREDPPIIQVDKRYEWLDDRQKGRLRNLFDRLMRSNLGREKMAKMVSGEMEAVDTDLLNVQTEV